MTDTETFFRLHANPQAPCFCAEHAYSGLWGAEWDADGARNHCRNCDGTGTSLVASDEECDTCDGEGWEDAQLGYSCCDTAQELVEYIDEHGIADADDPVVIFEGQQVGTGFDGEPLAVPTGAVTWTTWGALRTQVAA